jgi:tRNA (guanine26-N2/guanine27-N2)-dimethyltransferase
LLAGKNYAGLKILEALSATGIRSVRYAKEIPSITHMVANDISKTATDLMKENLKLNSVENVEVRTSDAAFLMHQMRSERNYFNVVDLDPYGSAIPFLEGAFACMARKSLLCVTFTDMGVLCARQPHVCYYKYSSIPLGKPYCHEMALRIVLYTIGTIANRYGKAIKPLISLSVDFYIRLFIEVKDSPSTCH